jgi:hypothetical protein
MSRRTLPTRAATLVSKSFVKRLLHDATGASRVGEDTVDDAVAGIEAVVGAVIESICEAYDDQLTTRRLNFPQEAAMPALHPRHVLRGLAGLSRTLPAALKKHLEVNASWTAPWGHEVTSGDATPEAA